MLVLVLVSLTIIQNVFVIFIIVFITVDEKTLFAVHVHVSPSSAKTLVRRGGITKHHLIAYSLSNISAKNYHNQLMSVEVIVCNISVVFLRHSVDILKMYLHTKSEVSRSRLSRV